MNVVDMLASSELFSSFTPEIVESIAAHTHTTHLERNQQVFAQGDSGDALYIVCSGLVAIANRSLDGRESVMALMEQGDLFGDMSLFDGKERSADARVLEATELLVVPFAPILELFEKDPSLLWQAVAFLSRRLRTTDAVLADAVFLDVPGRTAKRLLELAGPKDSFIMPVTQEELAAMVGASRERVNKALSTFVRLGWITQSDRKYNITDRAQLELRSR